MLAGQVEWAPQGISIFTGYDILLCKMPESRGNHLGSDNIH